MLCGRANVVQRRRYVYFWQPNRGHLNTPHTKFAHFSITWTLQFNSFICVHSLSIDTVGFFDARSNHSLTLTLQNAKYCVYQLHHESVLFNGSRWIRSNANAFQTRIVSHYTRTLQFNFFFRIQFLLLPFIYKHFVYSIYFFCWCTNCVCDSNTLMCLASINQFLTIKNAISDNK